jgi:hypothetical protein
MLCKVRNPVGGGRRISKQIRELIFQMVADNPSWGAPRIHGELLMLWLANRVPGCRYIQLDAGVASRADVQQQIISDLQRNAVKLAVLQDWRRTDDTFRRHVNPDSRVLDDFFAATFREVARFGTFSVVERKE